MRTPEIDYDQKGHDELLQIAKERGVPDLEVFRKSEIKRYLRAQDDQDEDIQREVLESARERTRKQSVTASKVMERAKANAGRPIAEKPRADAAQAKPNLSAIEGESELLVEEDVAPRPPIFVPGAQNSGADLVARVLSRAAVSRGTVQSAVPKRSLGALALEMAKANGQTGKPYKGGDVPVYEVTESTRYHSAHGTYHLPAGSFVTERTHDMGSLRMQGVKLRQIDPAKVEIEYSDLGFPMRLKTQPMAFELSTALAKKAG